MRMVNWRHFIVFCFSDFSLDVFCFFNVLFNKWKAESVFVYISCFFLCRLLMPHAWYVSIVLNYSCYFLHFLLLFYRYYVYSAYIFRVGNSGCLMRYFFWRTIHIITHHTALMFHSVAFFVSQVLFSNSPLSASFILSNRFNNNNKHIKIIIKLIHKTISEKVIFFLFHSFTLFI